MYKLIWCFGQVYCFIESVFSKYRLAISYGYYILSIFNNFIVSLIKRDKLELLTAFSKIAAFSYVNKPPIVPKGWYIMNIGKK